MLAEVDLRFGNPKTFPSQWLAHGRKGKRSLLWITGRDGGVGGHNYVGKELENFLSHKERIELTEKVQRGDTLAHFGRTPGVIGCVKIISLFLGNFLLTPATLEQAF